MSWGFFEPIVIITLINVMLTMGLYVTALSGQLSLATAALAGIGGYVAAVLTTNFNWPFLPATAIATVAGAVGGMVLALVTLKMRDFILKLTTLAFGEAAAVLAFNIDYIGGANSFTGIPYYTGLWTVLLGALIAIYIAWRFDESRLGLASRAVRDDPLAAQSSGVSLRQVRVVTFTLGAAICGAAGSIQAHYTMIINPDELRFLVSLNYIIFLLFGGIQTLWGPILGAVLLTVLPEGLRFANEFRFILYGLVIVVVVLFRPQGLIQRTPTGVPFRLFGRTVRSGA
jgi:branched-chain amino acid transport system permease protein